MLKRLPKILLGLLAFANIAAGITYAYVSKTFYLGTYHISLFSGLSLAVVISCVFGMFNKSRTGRRWIAIWIVNGIFTAASVVGFLYFMPQYTIDEAIDKVKADGQLDTSYTFAVDQPITALQTVQKLDWFTNAVYRIKATGEPDCIISFYPVTGQYHKNKE